MIFSVVLKFLYTFYICINVLMYIKLFFTVHGHHFNFLSIYFVKLHNTPSIGGLTTIKSLFSKETETTKVLNLFDLHHILVNDATMH